MIVFVAHIYSIDSSFNVTRLGETVEKSSSYSDALLFIIKDARYLISKSTTEEEDGYSLRIKLLERTVAVATNKWHKFNGLFAVK